MYAHPYLLHISWLLAYRKGREGGESKLGVGGLEGNVEKNTFFAYIFIKKILRGSRETTVHLPPALYAADCALDNRWFAPQNSNTKHILLLLCSQTLFLSQP